MRTVLHATRPDRRHRATVRPVEALLGGRRQRAQQGRRRRGADQAQRALLQVDRLRRHRGQEAHRPVVRAADPRVRGRPRRLDGRRRRQGGRHLPGPQGHAHRRSPTTTRPASRPTSRSACRRSTRRSASSCRRWSVTCSATRRRWPSTRSARPLREAREVIEQLVGQGLSGDEVVRPAEHRAALAGRTVPRRAARRAPTTVISRRAPPRV